MKLILSILMFAGLSLAADKNAAITGVWRVQMDGLPAVAMTISDEGGELTGAILF